MIWQCGRRTVNLRHEPAVMGIINTTPDSFSDGGQFSSVSEAIDFGLELAEAGADILDIGGESTRPGAEPVSPQQEVRRIEPVIEGLRRHLNRPISIDTSKTTVARAALAAGANIINDITALSGDPDMMELAAESGAGVVLMHMQGTPQTMQKNPSYGDVIAEIGHYLRQRFEEAVNGGIHPECIVLDPGIGFGKTLEHNLEIFRRMHEWADLPRPLLVGPSRKGFIGRILDLPADQRLEGTAAAVTAAILAGARIVRVHDVKVMKRVARMAAALSRWPTQPT